MHPRRCLPNLTGSSVFYLPTPQGLAKNFSHFILAFKRDSLSTDSDGEVSSHKLGPTSSLHQFQTIAAAPNMLLDH